MTQPSLPITLEPITDPKVDGYRYLGLLSARIMTAKSVEMAASWIVQVLSYTWDLSTGSIWWRDRSKELYRLYECIGPDGCPMRATMEHTFIADEHNPVIHAVRTGGPFSKDLAHYQIHNPRIREAVQLGLTHGMWGPIRYKERLIGAIELMDRRKFHPMVIDQLQVGINILEQYVGARKAIGRWRNMAIYCQALSDTLTKAKPSDDPITVLTNALYEYCGTIGALHYRLWMPNGDGRFTLRGEQGLLVDLKGISSEIPDPGTQMAIKTGRMVIEHQTSEQDWTGDINLYENGVRSVVSLLVTDHIGCPFAAITLFLPEHPDDRDNAALGIMESLSEHLYLVVKAYLTQDPA